MLCYVVLYAFEGVEMNPWDVPVIQKRIVETCKMKGVHPPAYLPPTDHLLLNSLSVCVFVSILFISLLLSNLLLLLLLLLLVVLVVALQGSLW